jgi:FtsZ-binding cell division protein ZapB
MLDAADQDHMRRIRAENTRGGYARGVVAAVASALDVDIDEGPGHRWDLDHMQRVVPAAESLAQERDDVRGEFAGLSELLSQARDQRNVWKESFETLEERLVQPLRRELREEREKNAALGAEARAARAALRREPPRMVIHTTAAERRDWESSDLVTADVLAKIAATAPVGSLVDDLKNVIVSQAREIARLKGETE